MKSSTFTGIVLIAAVMLDLVPPDEARSSAAMKLITLEEMRSAIKAAVAEKGEDFVYPRESQCLYNETENGPPRCIVGDAVHRLRPSLILKEGAAAAAALAGFATTSAIMYALVAQVGQDNRYSWGTALRSAEDLYERELRSR
jgi:hypothetical protein